MTLTKSFKRKHGVVSVFLLTLLLLIYLFAARPFLRAVGATTYSSLSSHSKDIVLDDAESLLAKLPPLDDLSDDSLRFVAMPSFGKRWLAVALSKEEGRASGQLAVLNRETGIATNQTFQMRESDFDKLTKQWDAQTDNYWGELRMWTDGTPLGFERKRGYFITSGIGNSPCHYDVLGNLAAVYIGPYADEILDLRVPNAIKFLENDYC